MKKVAASIQVNGRFTILIICFILAVIGVCARAYFLQIHSADFLMREGNLRAIREESIPAHRGIITDRNGMALAVSTPLESIWINPRELISLKKKQGYEKLLVAISKATQIPTSTIRNKIEKYRSKEFIYLARGLAPEVAQGITKQVPTGLYSVTEYGRFYPAGKVASHLVGITNVDEVGQEGVELAYESWLRGESGKKKSVWDVRGRRVKDLSIIQPAQAGSSLQLSIDTRIQHIAYKELELAVKKHRADSGSIAILDVESGELLSMANAPSFNPNNRDYIDVDSMRNRAVTDLFEPGSTVKPFTVAAALESGRFDADTLVNTRPIYLNRKRIEDIHYYGLLSVERILTKSSNVGAARLALSVGPEAINHIYQRLGLGQTTSSGLPGERSGGLPVHVNWKKIDVATLSYGYGLSVTTLQLAHAYATLANDGVRIPVSLLKVNEMPRGERVLPSDVANRVINMLETVVSRKGTAAQAEVEGYRVAGKTGTVHLTNKQGYADNQYLSLFAGIVPASNPRFVAIVVVNNPKGEDYYGGAVAAPIFSNVMKQALPLLDVYPDNASLRVAQLSRSEG